MAEIIIPTLAAIAAMIAAAAAAAAAFFALRAYVYLFRTEGEATLRRFF